MHFDAGVAKLPEAIEYILYGLGVELRMGDQVVKEIAIQVKRARLQRRKALHPGDDARLAARRQTDVRVADDENLTGGNHAPSPAASRREIPRPAKRGEGGRRPGEGRCITEHSSSSRAGSDDSAI